MDPIVIHAIEGAQFVAERVTKRNDPISQSIVTRALTQIQAFTYSDKAKETAQPNFLLWISPLNQCCSHLRYESVACKHFTRFDKFQEESQLKQ